MAFFVPFVQYVKCISEWFAGSHALRLFVRYIFGYSTINIYKVVFYFFWKYRADCFSFLVYEIF